MPIRYGSGPARQNSTPNICITKWDTSIAGGTATGVKIPLVNSAANEYRLNIDWGDGTKETLQNRSGIPLQHTYDETGIYTIRMVGTILGWDNTNFLNQDDAKLIDIVNWGPLTLKNDNSFYGSTNLTYISADDYPNFRFVSAFEGAGTKSMFANCSNLTGIKNLASWTPSEWDIDGDMTTMFNNCTNFNDSGLLALDYSNITKMPGLVGTAWTHSWSGVDLTSVTYLDFPTNYCQTYTLEGHLVGSFRAFFSFQTLSGIAGMGHVEAWNNLPNLTDVVDGTLLFRDCDFSSSGDWVTGLDLSNIETGNSMFLFANNLNLDMSVFNFQKLKSADSMFSNLQASSQPQANFNSTGLENTRLMFTRAYAFTGSVDIDTSNVTDMDRMFFRNYEFNHPSVTGWNTSNVTNMYGVFETAYKFNQDIGNWDTSNVQTMDRMFYGATVFDQDLSNWIVTGVSQALIFATDVTLSTTNYDRTLSGWAQQSGDLQSGVNIDFGNSKYSVATGQQYRNILTGVGWSITDGGSV